MKKTLYIYKKLEDIAKATNIKERTIRRQREFGKVVQVRHINGGILGYIMKDDILETLLLNNK